VHCCRLGTSWTTKSKSHLRWQRSPSCP